MTRGQRIAAVRPATPLPRPSPSQRGGSGPAGTPSDAPPSPDGELPAAGGEATSEEKRQGLLDELAGLESGSLLDQRYDNPRGGGSGSGGNGSFFSPVDNGAAMTFETQGVDWGPYARRLHGIVKRNWIIPPAAQIGTKGVVRIRFEITKSGQVRNLEILNESGTRSLDEAAVSAISGSDPLPPPPLPDGDEFVGVRFGFFYNVPIPG
jgi:TonB family protein